VNLVGFKEERYQEKEGTVLPAIEIKPNYRGGFRFQSRLNGLENLRLA